MDILLALSAFLLALLGIAGCIIPALPGALLSFGALLCSWCASYSQIGTATIWMWLLFTCIVSIADYLLPAWMTRKFGGSRAGVIGATVGTIAGFLIFPPLGILFGPFVGAVIGELCNDRQAFSKALRVGFGSFMAFLAGTGIKLIVSIGILIQIIADIYPPLREWIGSLLA